MIYGYKLPNQEEMEKAAKIATVVACCLIVLKMTGTISELIREHRQNKKMKKMNRQIEDLDERVRKLENK